MIIDEEAGADIESSSNSESGADSGTDSTGSLVDFVENDEDSEDTGYSAGSDDTDNSDVGGHDESTDDESTDDESTEDEFGDDDGVHRQRTLVEDHEAESSHLSLGNIMPPSTKRARQAPARFSPEHSDDERPYLEDDPAD
jgi:hypothetical protein